MASNKPVKTRDDYALGMIDKRTGKRPGAPRYGGFLAVQMAMAQNQQKLASGEISMDDLMQRAYEMADAQIARNAAPPGEDPVTFAEEDEQYRADQEARYRREYDWEGDGALANDDVTLTHLLDIEVEERRLRRELSRPQIPWKERTDLLSELRNLATTHSQLQKSLGMDRATRSAKRAEGDPLQEWKRVLEDAEKQYEEDRVRFITLITEANTEAEMRPIIKDAFQADYSMVDALLARHRLVLGLPEEGQRD